jgi:hypothetical protein
VCCAFCSCRRCDMHTHQIPKCLLLSHAQVHKGYHKQLRKFVAVKRVNVTNKVGMHAGPAQA